MPEVRMDLVDNDQLLLGRIRAGDAEGFAALYGRHRQGVYLYCTRFLGRSADAEDVFQDVFLRFLECVRGGTAIGNVRGYLLSMAHNRCLNALRARHIPVDIGELDDLPAGDTPAYAEAEDLAQALQALPPLNRQALLLREYEGLSYQEIADLAGVPLSTVRKRIFNARQRLRTLLRSEDFPM